MVEYYFQDQVRWSFGFENPNKAAALIASLLPLLWAIGGLAWQTERKWLRGLLLALGSAALCAGWWMLFLTFSRGGIVAAAAAFVYIAWRERAQLRANRIRIGLAFGTTTVVGALFAGSNAAQRSTQWIAEREGSVVNRFDLWRGGMEMIASIPQGVGWGQSGAVYMQWFQPLEAATRYRTLVNSYLTFAAEAGLAIFGLALFLAILLWRATDRVNAGAKPAVLRTAARASIVGFAVAGIFSTTMEEWRLWVVPGLAIAFLLGWRLRAPGCQSLKPAFLAAILGGVVGCVALYATGAVLAAGAPVRIRLDSEYAEIRPSAAKAGREVAVWADPAVLGEDYGKLLRRFAAETGAALEVNGAAKNGILMASGDTVARLDSGRAGLFLIAPVRIESAKAQEILQRSKPVTLLMPSYDEDGRVAFWKQMAAEAGITPIRLEGVGSQVESAWEQIVLEVDRFSKEPGAPSAQP